MFFQDMLFEVMQTVECCVTCRERKIPITVRRYLPDGSYEDWGIDELIITDT